VYTGLGPVCGTINRRCGGCGAAGAFGGSGAGGAAVAAGGASGLRSTTGGAATTGGGFGSTRRGSGGVMSRGTRLTSSGGVTGLATCFSAAGVSSTAGGVGGAGGGGTTAERGMATPAFGGTVLTAGGAFAMAGLSGSGAVVFFSAFRTSPGLEILEKSNFGLISSLLFADFLSDDGAEPRRYTRTRAASSSSNELECVFFSVTPTSGSVSRIALLLTSSSLAKSLMRTFDIRCFLSR
jgi:hypothetical protein